jgi:predicted Rossmann-fold nucleotide-binding protein
VCGGRDYDDSTLVHKVLAMFHDNGGVSLVIEGGAHGADALARQWAMSKKVHCATVPALWNSHGKAAGPLRNKAMLLLSPNQVIAFPGGRGTANMIELATQAGIPVLDVSKTERKP